MTDNSQASGRAWQFARESDFRVGVSVLTLALTLSGCVSNSRQEDLAPSQVCLRDDGVRCFGPEITNLSETELRSLDGEFALSCDGADSLDNNTRAMCVSKLRETHASMSKRWIGQVDFVPFQDSDIESSYPCVDFADKRTGQLVDGWCWEQFQVKVRFTWIEVPSTPGAGALTRP